MRNNLINRKGFTLVEMIVVIAIIAILAAVIIPTTAGFIDRARLSNDRQQASSMTQAIQSAYILGEISGELDAEQARQAINNFTDDNFNFETTSRNTGIFFIPNNENSRVIVLSYDDAASFVELNSTPSRFLNTVNANLGFTPNSPEQLFGNDRILLTQSGHPVAEMVSYIRNFGPNKAVLDEMSNNSRFLGFLRGNQQIDAVKRLYRSDLNPDAPFNPEHTLHVTNTAWRWSAQTGSLSDATIKRIVFGPSISNIPAFDAYFDDYLASGEALPPLTFEGLSQVKLPTTVRTIERYAFFHIPDSVSVSSTTNAAVYMHRQAFRDTSLRVQGSNTVALNNFQWLSRLMTFQEGDGVKVTFSENGATYDFSALSIRQNVTGYSVTITGTNHVIKIYTNQGLVAQTKAQIQD